MTADRLAEIRARLDALATPTPWDVDVVRGSWTDSVVSQVEPHAIVAQWIVSTDAAFIASAPDDIAWLLERESQMMGALKMMSEVALHCCDAAIGRDSLDECLRDFGFTLDEVEARNA